MKKSSLFVSAVLSTFVLAVLAGVLTAYRNFSGNQLTQSAQVPVVVTIATPGFTAEAAAQVAAQFLGRTDLYSVQNVILNGESMFEVTFSSGDVVYVSPAGQVVSTVAAPAPIINTSVSAAQPTNPIAPSNGDHHDDDHD